VVLYAQEARPRWTTEKVKGRGAQDKKEKKRKKKKEEALSY